MTLNIRFAALSLLLAIGGTTGSKTVEDVERVLSHRRRHLSQNDVIQSAHIKKIVKNPQDFLDAEDEGGYYVEYQLQPEYNETLSPLELVQETEIQMSRLSCEPDSCKTGATMCERCSANYCLTNQILVADAPYKYPTYMFVTDTDHCRVQSKTFGLNALHGEITGFDDVADAPTESVPVAMVIMEMGFTDADRLTKGLSADPANLVLVNPQPLYEAIMQCDDKRKSLLSSSTCDRTLAAEMVKKVAYLLCRARKEDSYERCVFKMWADTTVALDIIEAAFPDSQLEYIYTESDQYMGGMIFDPDRPIRAPCAKQKRNPSKLLKAKLEERGMAAQDLSVEELCAIESDIQMEMVIKSQENSGRLNMLHADTLTDEDVMDGVADRLHGTQGVGIPAHVRDKVLDVVDKDERGNKDPDRYTNNKNKRTGNVGASGKAAIDSFMKGKHDKVKELGNKGKGNSNRYGDTETR
mmetsp:Transcript_47677/g.57733  ORF Transcript_47677/g.57733 Transcript_47677/m.57733 type:complete len:468 (+) Transcript_47677:121-1524(+)|eukprot:CAMPEP_0172481548 /NCGR_PEP_ID=MMETSP1066-20121228/7507_1 /TAXON_ID=671091 /ORGANISM="Coscinodiscus wailesii, Strain CCMP2513" /LENGTH=467 /DNA_ID=CAMNT_0013243949 /DNA_START=69 /DNA_END=1472 /DNA_ORIENTATION=-